MTNREELKGAAPDREPTPDEEAAAERALPDVDVDAVAEEYEHMTDIGVRVHGEGQIEPDSPSWRLDESPRDETRKGCVTP